MTTSLAAPAIEYRRRPAVHQANDYETCLTPGCVAKGSSKTNHDGFSMAVFMVYILGRPVGGLCQPCKTLWERTWDAALNGWPADEVTEARAA